MTLNDNWDSGDRYDMFMGRWSRLTAVHFVQWLAAEPGLVWVDVGCGTGALTAVLQQHAQPKQIIGIEPSSAFVETAQARHGNDATTFKVGDAANLPLDDAQADWLVSGLALNFFPDLPGALTEMRRVVKPGGVIAAYVWDYAGEMQFLRAFWDTAVLLDPSAADFDEGSRFPICQPEPLRQLFADAVLQQVVVSPLDVPTHFTSFDDYWQPFLGGVGPAPAYYTALSAAQQPVFAQQLRQTLPIAEDGSISLVARAWAVRGTVISSVF